MKKTFTKKFILSNRGCFEREEVEKIPCINNKVITLKQLFRDLPIKDFTWFLVKKCDLTIAEKRKFALYCAKQVLPIYEEKYPKDKRVRECIEATELYLNDKISLDDLREKQWAAASSADADDAAYAAYAAYTAAYAADAADYTADAASAAASSADAADYTADAADAYKQSIWEFITTEL